MSDIFGTLNIGRVALTTQQTAINVTSHNIANVNTSGYSRQRVNMSSTSSIDYQGLSIGTGVRTTDIQRIYDRFIDRQILSESSKLGYWETTKSCLERVEIIFNETGESGLSRAMNDFWSAWNDLADNPSGYAERISLLSKSNTLTMKFNETYLNLNQIQKDISENINADLESINLISTQIRDLNQQIVQTEVNGRQANDLRDKRDLLVKELSSLIDIEVTEDDFGNLNIFVGGGRPLASGIDTWELSLAPNPDPLLHDVVVWNGEDGNIINIGDKLSGGEVKGLIEVRDSLVPDYIDRLDELAKSLITGINNLHSSGENLNGNAGGLFFNATIDEAPAKYISIAIDDPNLIAAASIGGGTGDNSKAIEISALQNTLIMNGNTATFDAYYQAIVSDIGSAVKYAENNYDDKSSMINYLNNYRESISGVSLDEEMINLVKYQHAYEAASKIINAVDEMLAILLGLV